MKQHFLLITTAASILVCGTLARTLKKIVTSRPCSSWNKRSDPSMRVRTAAQLATE